MKVRDASSALCVQAVAASPAIGHDYRQLAQTHIHPQSSTDAASI